MMTRQRIASSGLVPTILRKLASRACRNVLLLGCGGGFDFVHGMLLYGELVRMGKRVTIGSYSFGKVDAIGDPAPVVFTDGDAVAKLVTAKSAADPVYAPEIHLCSYLDERLPRRAPHSIYAYYARDFNVRTLSALYASLVDRHAIDTVILIDGGTDSLMVGDEEGIGDPIEDITSLAAVATLKGVRNRWLLSVGFGVDRYNGVSDASSLRAVAELSRSGGSLGSFAVEQASDSFRFYRDAVEHIYARQRFRSAATGFIVSAVEGYWGGDAVPPALDRKLTADDRFFVWPLMATIFAFDVDAVARRSRLVGWLADAETQVEAYQAISAGRRALGDSIRLREELPSSAALAGQFGVDFTNLQVIDRGEQPEAELEELTDE